VYFDPHEIRIPDGGPSTTSAQLERKAASLLETRTFGAKNGISFDGCKFASLKGATKRQKEQGQRPIDKPDTLVSKDWL
jgi:hypothetical protein